MQERNDRLAKGTNRQMLCKEDFCLASASYLDQFALHVLRQYALQGSKQWSKTVPNMQWQHDNYGTTFAVYRAKEQVQVQGREMTREFIPHSHPHVQLKLPSHASKLLNNK